MAKEKFRALAAKALRATRQDADMSPDVIKPPAPGVRTSDISFSLTETERREMEEATQRVRAIMGVDPT